MWGHNIGVVIIPSLLAFAFLGQSILIFTLAGLNLLLLAIWITGGASSPLSIVTVQGHLFGPGWEIALLKTAIAMSMAVNILVTGLIVFRILKVYLQVRTTLDNQNLGITDRSGTFRRVIFIVVESGMALFCIQLTRLVTSTGIVPTEAAENASMALDYLHPMLNVIMSFLLIISLMKWPWLGYNTHNNSSAGVNGIVFP